MKKKEHKSLIHHSLHGRHAHGCLPLFFLVSCIFFGVIFWTVPVELPKPIKPAGVGQVMISDTGMTLLRVRHSAPFPMLHALSVDPGFKTDMADQEMPLVVPASLQLPPREEILPPSPESYVLFEDDLLELPPAQEEVPPVGQDVQTAEDNTSVEQEVQP